MAALNDVAQAMAYLHVHSPQEGTSMYDHLVNLVSKVGPSYESRGQPREPPSGAPSGLNGRIQKSARL